MMDRFFLGIFFVILLLLSGFTLYERTEINRLDSQIAELRYEMTKVQKEQRVSAQDVDFMRKLITGYEFWEVEDE